MTTGRQQDATLAAAPAGRAARARAVAGQVLVVLLVGSLAAPPLRAQEGMARVVALARTQFDLFNADSALHLLQYAIAHDSEAPVALRVRMYVLYGIAQLTLKNAPAARQGFHTALLLNPTERVDSLEFLEPDDLLREFNAERGRLGPAPVPPPAPPARPPTL